MKEKGQAAHGIRTLYPEEIECRIGMIKNSGLSLLLYKDARVDQKLLDEAFGPFNWKREHEVIGNSVYCTVSVRDRETGEWISKQDVGSVSGNTEKEKALASDSFKRACVNWGIGRELYTAPFIWISSDSVPIRNEGGRFVCNERFRVVGISYTSQNEIASIVIETMAGKRVFVWQDSRSAMTERKDVKGDAQPQEPVASQHRGSSQKDFKEEPSGNGKKGITIREKTALASEMERTGVTMEMVRERFEVGDPSEMSPEVYKKLMRALAATQSRQAA